MNDGKFPLKFPFKFIEFTRILKVGANKSITRGLKITSNCRGSEAIAGTIVEK